MAEKPTPAPAHQPPDLSSLCLAAVERAPLPMTTVEGASHIVRYVNPAFCRLMDPMKQLVGKPFCELVPENDDCVAMLDRVFHTGQTESYVEQEPRPGFWSYTMWPVISDDHPVGVMIQVTETAQFHEKTVAMNTALILSSLRQHELTEASNVHLQKEIIERKQADEALHQSETRNNAIIESALDAVITMDHEGKLVEFNAAAEKIFGHSRAKALGKPLAELIIPPRLREKHYQGLARYLTTGEGPVLNRQIELPAVRADGTEFPAEFAIVPIPGRHPPMFTAFLRDISVRKKAEHTLAEQAHLLNLSTDAIIVRDAQDRIVYWNDGAETLYGWSRQESLGKVIHSLLQNEFPKPIEQIMTELHQNYYWIGEVVQTKRDGQRITVLSRWALDQDKEGNPPGVMAVNTDITERKRAEERQHFLMNELAHRGKNLLAVVLSIASRSLSGTQPLIEAREVFMQRIHALARSQSVLLTGGFEGAPVAEIIRLEFEVFSERVKAIGPDVMLNPKTAQSFTLLVHELATNAAKHGALSRPEGQIAIHWSIEGVGAEAKFKFQWQERNGPPVAPPTHRGFGRILLEKLAAQDFGAPPKIKFAPEGLSYEIEAPLSAAAAGSGGTTVLEGVVGMAEGDDVARGE